MPLVPHRTCKPFSHQHRHRACFVAKSNKTVDMQSRSPPVLNRFFRESSDQKSRSVGGAPAKQGSKGPLVAVADTRSPAKPSVDVRKKHTFTLAVHLVEAWVSCVFRMVKYTVAEIIVALFLDDC